MQFSLYCAILSNTTEHKHHFEEIIADTEIFRGFILLMHNQENVNTINQTTIVDTLFVSNNLNQGLYHTETRINHNPIHDFDQNFQ